MDDDIYDTGLDIKDVSLVLIKATKKGYCISGSLFLIEHHI